MPIFTLNTNVPTEKVPANLAANLVNVVAKALGKPASYVVVQINAGQNLNWGGSNDPCGIATLGSIGAIGRDENKKTSAELSKVLSTELGITNTRLYIAFSDFDKQNIGYQGTTFDDLL